MNEGRAFHYRAYGLVFSSELELPQFLPVAAAAGLDARIRFGPVPETLGPGRREGYKFEVRGAQTLIKTPRYAFLLISGGSEIRIRPNPEATAAELRMLVLGVGVGALLHQRGILPLHAGVIARHGGAVAFCAASGTGKSTLTAALVQQGFRIMDDNLAALELGGEVPLVHPGCPEIKLFDDVLARCPPAWREGAPSGPCGPKTGLILRPQFEPEARALRGIFILAATPSPPRRPRRLHGPEAVQAIHDHIFCARFMDHGLRSGAAFTGVLALAGKVPVYALDLGIPKLTPERTLAGIQSLLNGMLPASIQEQESGELR